MNKHLLAWVACSALLVAGCDQNKNNQITKGSTRRFEIDPYKNKDRRPSLLDRTKDDGSSTDDPLLTSNDTPGQTSGNSKLGSDGGFAPGVAMTAEQSDLLARGSKSLDLRLLDVTSVGADYKLIYDQAQDLMRRGQYQQALVRLDEAKAIDPKNSVAYLGEAVCYFRMEKYGQSLAAMEFVLRSDPSNVSYIGNRATIKQALGDNRGAIEDWNVVLEKLPEDLGALGSRAFLHGLIGSHPAAVADYDKLTRLEPTNALHYVNRGVAYYNQKKWNEAIQNATKAVELNPKMIDGFLLRAVCKALQKDAVGGRPDYDEAVRLGLTKTIADRWRPVFYPPTAPASASSTTSPPSAANESASNPGNAKP